MQYGIINLNLIAVRKKNSAKSEMISQFFFGELIKIISKKDNWSLVVSKIDNYEGWIRSSQFLLISEKDYSKLINKKKRFCHSELLIQNEDKINCTVPSGSLISNCKYLGYSYDLDNVLINDLEEISMTFINSPYLWGGKTKFGTDCSGFVQTVFKIYGKILPRDANQQAHEGFKLTNISKSKPGDLAFFGETLKKITHVGIIISENKIIHSSGKVRVDKLIQLGILNCDSNEITHKLQLIRRVI